MSDPYPVDPFGRLWVCTSCGETFRVDPSWRWTGGDPWSGGEMQHACDGQHPQVGHQKAVLMSSRAARRLGPTDASALCQNGHIRHLLDLCRNAEIGLEADAVKVARAAQTAVLAAYAMGRMS